MEREQSEKERRRNAYGWRSKVASAISSVSGCEVGMLTGGGMTMIGHCDSDGDIVSMFDDAVRERGAEKVADELLKGIGIEGRGSVSFDTALNKMSMHGREGRTDHGDDSVTVDVKFIEEDYGVGKDASTRFSVQVRLYYGNEMLVFGAIHGSAVYTIWSDDSFPTFISTCDDDVSKVREMDTAMSRIFVAVSRRRYLVDDIIDDVMSMAMEGRE